MDFDFDQMNRYGSTAPQMGFDFSQALREAEDAVKQYAAGELASSSEFQRLAQQSAEEAGSTKIAGFIQKNWPVLAIGTVALLFFAIRGTRL